MELQANRYTPTPSRPPWNPNGVIILVIVVGAIVFAAFNNGELEGISRITYAIGGTIGALLMAYIIWGIYRLVAGEYRSPEVRRFTLILTAIFIWISAVSQTVKKLNASGPSDIGRSTASSSTSSSGSNGNVTPPEKQGGMIPAGPLHDSPQLDDSGNQSGWPLPPMIAGEWQDFDSASYRKLLTEVIEQAPDEYKEKAQSISKIRCMTLNFVHAGYACEGLVDETRRPEIYTFMVVEGQGVTALTGSGAVITQVVQAGGLTLDTRAQAESYLRYFNAGIASGNGNFRLAEATENLDWLPSATPEDKAKAAKFVRPLIFSRSADGWSVNATVEYGSAIFSAVYEMNGSTGNVEMKDDFTLVEGLPLREMTFRGPVRVQIGARQ